MNGGFVFWRSWVVSVSLGETLGFAIPATVAGIALAAGLPEGIVIAVAVISGAGEGAVLGWSQARVLVRRLPVLSITSWVRWTAAGAMAAWACGWMTPVLADVFPDLGPEVLAPLGGLMSVALLLALSGAQWNVLRRYVPNAALWIPGNALVWALATPIVFVAMALVPDDASAWVFTGVGVVSGFGMAVVAAAGTGWVMLRILDAAERQTA